MRIPTRARDDGSDTRRVRTDELYDRPPESFNLGRSLRFMRAFVPPGRAYLLSPHSPPLTESAKLQENSGETSFTTDPPGAAVPAGFEVSGEAPE